MDMRTAIDLVCEGHKDKYPDRPFYLPVSKIMFYDDPYLGLGDEGWNVEELKADIAKNGIEMDIWVGRSVHDMEHNSSNAICCFNGNHRLAAAKELGIEMIMCSNSDADDADPLTIAEIQAMGGRLI